MTISLDAAAIPEAEWVRVCGTGDVADECTHAEVPLSEGDVENGTVECWMHGSRFDLRTGAPTGLPATEPVQVFPVRVDGDDVYVAVKE